MTTRQGEPIGQRLADVEPAPISYGQALKSIHIELWNQAMIAEFGGLKEKNMLQYVDVPKDRKPVEFKWFSDERLIIKGEWLEPKLDFKLRVSGRYKASTSTKRPVQCLILSRKNFSWFLLIKTWTCFTFIPGKLLSNPN